MKTTTTIKLLLTVFFIGCFTSAISQETEPKEKGTLMITIAEKTPFQQLFPSVEVYFLYGGMGQGVPTGQIGRIEADTMFPLHAHTNDYYAVIVSGNFQHWEEGDKGQGPIMTAGASYFQAGGVPHYDKCVGPEKCTIMVTFPKGADFYPIEEKEAKKTKN